MTTDTPAPDPRNKSWEAPSEADPRKWSRAVLLAMYRFERGLATRYSAELKIAAAERDALRHDVDRHIAIASEAMTERDALRAQWDDRQKTHAEVCGCANIWCEECTTAADAMAAETARADRAEIDRDALRAELDAATSTFEDEEAAHQDTLRLWSESRAEADALRAELNEAKGKIAAVVAYHEEEVAALRAERDGARKETARWKELRDGALWATGMANERADRAEAALRRAKQELDQFAEGVQSRLNAAILRNIIKAIDEALP